VQDSEERSSAPSRKVSFAVPTGNFGDILAGYYAQRMGLPVEKLMVCTNQNDVLHRFMQSGEYRRVPRRARESPLLPA
jgi:threonine synthase